MDSGVEIVVLISADIEWRAVRQLFPDAVIEISPFGEYLHLSPKLLNLERNTILVHGGWGKISAAASSQYVIDRWAPDLLINLGTCGGFEGEIERDTIILVDRTIIYDIVEQMGDSEAHIAHYSTEIDLSWLGGPLPEEVRRTLLVSGDRDLDPGEIGNLKRNFGAVAGDWESGAIAYVADRNGVPCLILRGVSDLVSESGGEAYDDLTIFEESAMLIMTRLIYSLPGWVEMAEVFTN